MEEVQLECIYLHGFASGPSSTKAKYIANHLEDEGFAVHLPDLNGIAFEDLTLSGQLAIVDATFASTNSRSDVLLIGSSMGGLLAAISSRKHTQVKAMVLLAPGFGLNRRWHEIVGADGLEQWRLTGHRNVFHYAYNAERPLKYEFILDAEKYQTEQLVVSVPTLVIHGRNDTVVPLYESQRFQELNLDSVELHVLESDHGLIDVLPKIELLTDEFLQRHGIRCQRQ